MIAALIGTLAAIVTLTVAAAFVSRATDRRIVWRVSLAAAALAALAVVVGVGVSLASQGLPAFATVGSLSAQAWLAPPRVLLGPVSLGLLPFLLLLLVVHVLMRPRAHATPRRLSRLLLMAAFSVASLVSTHPLVLILGWFGTAYVLWRELRDTPLAAGTARLFGGMQMLSLVAFASALLFGAFGDEWHRVALIALVLAVVLRHGLLPGQLWVADLFQHGPLGASLYFATPLLGDVIVLRLFYGPFAVASASAVGVLSVLALATTLYAAGLAIVQREPRRTLAYLWLSQSSLVWVAIGASSSIGWLSAMILGGVSAFASTGFGVTLWALEARRGALDLERYHGGYERMPLLATGFLVLGLGSVGLPGTLGFLGEELLGHALGHDLVALSVVLIATALNGITVMHVYFRLFCGAREPGPGSQQLRARERIGIVALVALMIASGFLPLLLFR
ncbi:MAG: hypothetical protein KC609_00165 [Myxococcales bacterium]|nr:hypothetical protein [Myxococcales bacterium]